MKTLAFVDLETTGSNFERDRITEVAIISLIGSEINRFETLLDPQTYIPSGITALTGINQSMVQGKPTFEEMATTLKEDHK